MTASAADNVIFSFGPGESLSSWRIVNDSVMGGISRSRVESNDGIMLFTGNLSLANNGGFASTRSFVPRELSPKAKGIWVRVRGDGRAYQFRVRIDNYYDGVSYRYPFKTTDGQWTEHRLPFDEFKAVYRGRSVRGAPKLSPLEIRQVGVLLADKLEAPFRLELDWIKTY